MSSIKQEHLQEFLALVETPEDFAEYQRLEAEYQAAQVEAVPVQVTRSKWTCSTLSEVAEFFGVALQTVKQWRTESPPMPGIEGAYPLQAVVKWREDKFRNSELSAEKKRQENELRQVQIDRKKLDLDIKRGEYIERAEVMRDFSVIFSRVKNRLDSLPSDVSTLMPAEQKVPVKRLVAEKVQILCKELAEGHSE